MIPNEQGLLPCPCGCTAIWDKYFPNCKDEYQISCTGISLDICPFNARTKIFKTKKEAIKAWNTRHPHREGKPQDVSVTIDCPKCGDQITVHKIEAQPTPKGELDEKKEKK